jgi:hypothetical protein
MENETASFSAYFTGRSRRVNTPNATTNGGAEQSTAQEVVVPLHDEALQLLSEIARSEGVTGSTTYMRSIALQLSLDRFSRFCREKSSEIATELHLTAGPIKDRAVCLFSDSLTELAALERDLRCSETILLETAIRQSADESRLALEHA